MGLPLRISALKDAAPTAERKRAITEAASRLVNTTPGGMGAQYKFLAVTGSRGLPLSAEQKWPFDWEE